MNEKVKRFVVPMKGTTEKAEFTALATAFERLYSYLRDSAGSRRDVCLFVPIKGNLSGTTLSRVLGHRLTAPLLRGDSVSYREGFKLRAESKRTILRPPHPRVVLAALADRQMLSILDRISNLEAVVVVPWEWEDIRDWAEDVGAEVVKVA